MTDATQAAWGERINILNSVCIVIPAQAEIAGLDVDPGRLRVAVRAAYGRGLRGDKLVAVIRDAADAHGSTSDTPETPGGGLAGGQSVDAAMSSATSMKPIGNDGGGQTKRRTTSRTMKTKGAKPMTAVRKKTKKVLDSPGQPRLRIASQDGSATAVQEPAGKPNGRGRGGPAKAEGQGPADVHPRLIDAAAAARLCGVSKSGWWAFHASGRCPLPVRLGRATRWRLDELTDWIGEGCPVRSKWTWRSGRRR